MSGRFERRDFGRHTKKQKLIRNSEEELESRLGFNLFTEGEKRLGWLLTFASSSLEEQETGKVHSCADLYFVTQDGSAFKSKYRFRPYFYTATKAKMEMDVEAYLRRHYKGQIVDIEIVDKEDLDHKNHLSGLRKLYLKISFDTVQQLMDVKRDLMHVVERNLAKFDAAEAYQSILTVKREQRPQDFLDCIIDLWEYDVPYHVRFAIDNDIRCGQWYDVSVSSAGVILEKRADLLQRAEVHVCAFDIETTKLPLKFPDADYDLIMMISYMVDGQGYLIINRERCLEHALSSRPGNVFADAILQHLYRWLCSPQSKLHDPAIHRILHKVMQKVFALLLAELRKLGATIIFASFPKVIIDTGKYDISAAKSYSDSLLKTLQTRELFEWIELELLQFWHSLLFMDQYNYGGIPARADGNSSTDTRGDNSQTEESQVDIVSNWSIAECLPKKIQDHFILIASEFMFIPWSYAQKQVASRASLQDGSSSAPSITIGAAETFESHLVEHLRRQISTYFTDKLLGIVRETVLHMKGIDKPENDQQISLGVPQLSANIHKADPALEFIKHVCAVLALDVMRKNLLKYVCIQEFAPEAEFHNPCPPFTLANVICSYCNDCRDLDLCRDSALLAQEWRCAEPQCSQPYDREVMENSLLQIVQQRERLYHLQDLVCVRCNQVKSAHLADQCACGGSCRCKEDASEFHGKIHSSKV